MELSTTELKFILGEIRRVLKTGGLALYSVRNTFDKHYCTGLHRSEDIYEVAGGFVVHFFSGGPTENTDIRGYWGVFFGSRYPNGECAPVPFTDCNTKLA